MTREPDERMGSKEVERVSKQIQPLLKGRGPEVQSAVLADLLAMWLAGHWPPEAREELLAEFIRLVRDLVPENEKQIFGPAGHPAGRNLPDVAPDVAPAPDAKSET